MKKSLAIIVLSTFWAIFVLVCLVAICFPANNWPADDITHKLEDRHRPEETIKVWLGPDGQPLPLKSNDEIETFLKTARVISMKDIGKGVTNPRKVLLEKNGVQMNAVFRDVNLHFQYWNDPGAGPRTNFRDSHIYECAAYELGKLLGLENIPPAVARTIDGTEGTIQIWVENAMMEETRREEALEAPDQVRWFRQLQVMSVFDCLIFNDDRNLGNILIDEDWNIHLIDHTRSFRTFTDLPDTSFVRRCDRDLLERLKRLDEETVKERLSDFLSKKEIESLVKRATKLVQYFEGLIETQGESRVLFSL